MSGRYAPARNVSCETMNAITVALIASLPSLCVTISSARIYRRTLPENSEDKLWLQEPSLRLLVPLLQVGNVILTAWMDPIYWIGACGGVLCRLSGDCGIPFVGIHAPEPACGRVQVPGTVGMRVKFRSNISCSRIAERPGVQLNAQLVDALALTAECRAVSTRWDGNVALG